MAGREQILSKRASVRGRHARRAVERDEPELSGRSSALAVTPPALSPPLRGWGCGGHGAGGGGGLTDSSQLEEGKCNGDPPLPLPLPLDPCKTTTSRKMTANPRRQTGVLRSAACDRWSRLCVITRGRARVSASNARVASVREATKRHDTRRGKTARKTIWTPENSKKV